MGISAIETSCRSREQVRRLRHQCVVELFLYRRQVALPACIGVDGCRRRQTIQSRWRYGNRNSRHAADETEHGLSPGALSSRRS